MKIKVTIASVLFAIFFGWNFASANSNKVNVYFFYGDGCPHCAKEEVFLSGLKDKYTDINVRSFEVWGSQENRQMLIGIGKELNINISGVPFTLVGDKYFIGWYDEKSTGAAIEEAIQYARSANCRDIGAEVLASICPTSLPVEEKCDYEEKKSPIPQKIKVPVIGEIEIKNFSLPFLTIILGVLDGFNPCAMWTLLFLISLLLGMKDRKRMWILGSAFIAASASVYFLFMSAWLNLILFLGFVAWIRILIGALALAGGGYSVKEFIFNKDAGCKVTGDEKRRRTFDRMKSAVQQNSLWLALGGIVVLAFAINLVELICSAGLPAVYTQVLTLNEMAGWHYYLYILLYIFFFMLDDLFIFFIAMITLEMAGITTKYARMSRLIGGLVMLAIGLMLIFKPEWLMFG